MSNTVTKAVLTFERATKGAVLYKNPDTSPKQAITNIYLRKTGMGEEHPNEIEVTITKVS